MHWRTKDTLLGLATGVTCLVLGWLLTPLPRWLGIPVAVVLGFVMFVAISLVRRTYRTGD